MFKKLVVKKAKGPEPESTRPTTEAQTQRKTANPPPRMKIVQRKLNRAIPWLHDSYPQKFDKRVSVLERREHTRAGARERDPKKRQKVYLDANGGDPAYSIPAADVRPAVEFYSVRGGDFEGEPRSDWAPYDRTLVHIQPTYTHRVFYPAGWVRTLCDNQWWIVAQRTGFPGRKPDHEQTRSARWTHLYGFFLLFFRQKTLPEALRTIDPPPQIWVQIAYEDGKERTDAMDVHIDPPSRDLPPLRVVVKKAETHGTYVKRDITIHTRNGNAEGTEAHVVLYAYSGAWPNPHDNDMDQYSTRSANLKTHLPAFLQAVDGECRRLHKEEQKPRAPIVIDWPEDGSARRPGPVMLSLSLLRKVHCSWVSNDFRMPPAYKPTSMHEKHLEDTWKRASPLQSIFSRISTGEKDLVFKEANNLLEQCPGAMGSTRKYRKMALGMVYNLLRCEERGERINIVANRHEDLGSIERSAAGERGGHSTGHVAQDGVHRSAAGERGGHSTGHVAQDGVHRSAAVRQRNRFDSFHGRVFRDTSVRSASTSRSPSIASGSTIRPRSPERRSMISPLSRVKQMAADLNPETPHS